MAPRLREPEEEAERRGGWDKRCDRKEEERQIKLLLKLLLL